MESVRAYIFKWEKIVPLLLALLGFMGCLQILDFFRPEYYPMVHRATIVERFELGISLVLPLLFLLLFWMGWAMLGRHWRVLPIPALSLLAFPFMDVNGIVALASIFAVICGLFIDRRFEDFLFWIFIVLIGLSGTSLLHWVAYALGFSSPFTAIARLETSLFYLLGYLVPIFALLFMSSWILVPLFQIILGFNTKEDATYFNTNDFSTQSRGPILLIIFSIGLGIVSALLPYFPAVNPNGLIVGVDAENYIQAGRIVERDFSQAFSVLGGSRPLVFMIIYIIQRIFAVETATVVKFLPVILIPMLSLSAAYLSWEVFQNRWMSGWTAFFTVCGYQTTVGMYSYFLSNMMALIFVFFSLALFFKALKNKSVKYLCTATILNSLLIFTHPWTFTQYFSTMIIIFIIKLYHNRSELVRYHIIDIEIKFYITYIISLIFIDILKIALFKSTEGVLATQTVFNHIISLSQFWTKMIFGFRYLYGGLESTYIIFILSLIGLLFIKKHHSNNFFYVFIAVNSLPFILGNESIKARLLYNTPIGVYAMIGLYACTRNISQQKTYKLFILFITINLINNLFRSLINII